MLFLIDRNSFSHQTLQIYIKFFWKEKTVTGQEKPHNMHLVPVYDQKSSKNWDKLVSYLFQGYDFIERTLKCSWGPGTCSKIILELLSDVLIAYMYRGQIHEVFPTHRQNVFCSFFIQSHVLCIFPIIMHLQIIHMSIPTLCMFCHYNIPFLCLINWPIFPPFTKTNEVSLILCRVAEKVWNY